MKRSLLIGIAGATISLGTVASASAAPLTLDSPTPVADSGSTELGSSQATSTIVGALVGLLPTGSAAGIANGVGSAANATVLPALTLLCSLSSGGKGCFAGQTL